MSIKKAVLFLGSWLKKIFLDEYSLLVIKASNGEESFRARFQKGEWRCDQSWSASNASVKDWLCEGADRHPARLSLERPLPHNLVVYVKLHPVECIGWDGMKFWEDISVAIEKVPPWSILRLSPKWLAHTARAALF